MLEYERDPNGTFRPIIVYLATGDQIAAKADPCNPRAMSKVDRLRETYRPRPDDHGHPGTWENWITWALDHFSNGHVSWAVEVEPTATIGELYGRYEAEIRAMSPAASWPPAAQAIEPDPVGEASGIELVEITEGVILSIGRETDRRLYGVISAPDGGPPLRACE